MREGDTTSTAWADRGAEGLEEEMRAGPFQGEHEDPARESVWHSKEGTGWVPPVRGGDKCLVWGSAREPWQGFGTTLGSEGASQPCQVPTR